MASLVRVLAAVSLAVALGFAAWGAWGPAPLRQAAPVWGNGRYMKFLEKYPDEAPTDPYYALMIGGIPVDFAGIILVASILPFFVAAQWTIRKGRALLEATPGLCAGCGYDLRATPQRCPECGRITDATTAGPRLDIRP